MSLFYFSMNMSHIALVMDTHGDLFVFKNKGRPTNKEVQHIKMHVNLRKKLNTLKRTLMYKDGTDILLILSVFSDEMIRAQHFKMHGNLRKKY